MTSNNKYTNHLIDENSPYLLQHAHNPVNWYPWGQEALEKAKRENKMLIISVGYAACHWCHVMEHESYEDSLVASIMNEHFISIKVDREERPDIDDVYMSACQLSNNRSCGWPLNAFALPDGRPVWAGTYFPKAQWIKILNQFVRYYDQEPEKLEEAAQNILQGIKQMDHFVANKEKTEFSAEFVKGLQDKFIRGLDKSRGGRAGQPKFPLPNNYQLLLQSHDIFKDNESLEAVQTILDNMAKGGIYDQLGGGFARYSTDRNWLVPHFEKMLYDNGQLVSLYAEAYQLTKSPVYKKVIEQSLGFIEREMTSPEGGFYSSLDADSEGEEGKFYVWSYEEIENMLGQKPGFELFTDYYNITKQGNWEHGKNILHIDQSLERIAGKYKLSVEEAELLLKEGVDRLMKKRDGRIRPGLDDKILTSWNGLMLKAYIDAYKALGDEKYFKTAEISAQFILNKLMDDDYRLWRSYKDGNAKINAFLDDYATVIYAFMGMYEISFEEKYLVHAERLLQYALNHFYDGKKGVFYYTSDLDPSLITRKTEWTDNVIPGSASMMAKNLFLMSEFLSNTGYFDISNKMMSNILPVLNQVKEPAYYSNWISLYLHFYRSPYEVAILGPNAGEFRDQMIGEFLPNAIFLGGNDEGKLVLLQDKLVEDQTMVYVCQNRVCKFPVNTVKEAMGLLK